MKPWTKLAIAIGMGVCLAGAPARLDAREKVTKVAVVTGGHAFQEKQFLEVFRSYVDIDAVHLPQKDHSELFEDISNWPYDVIVLYNMTQQISPKRQANFLKLLEGGVGIVALHHNIAAFQTWPEYEKIIGARYFLKPTVVDGVERPKSAFKHGIRIDVRLADPRHPVVAGIKDFTIEDEGYKGWDCYPDNRLLLTCEHPNAEKAVAWTREYRRARVCGIALGHDEKAYANESFRRLLFNAIHWTEAGRVHAQLHPTEPNVPPKGFVALFNGKDLTGWKGLVASPPARAKMSAEQLTAKQAEADKRMREHWKVEDGALAFDGKGDSLCTAKDYGDFEMLVDWKIEADGDSGIYLRGSPQVQIWDPAKHPEGSGGLYNNKKNPAKPLKCADKPVGEWNTFRIFMVGERVTVDLNGVRVVDNVVMENYWERDKPIYPVGQIELQNHKSKLWFRNVFIREHSRDGQEENL